MTDNAKFSALAIALCALPALIHFGLRQQNEPPPQSFAAQKNESPAPRAAASSGETFFFSAESDDDLFRRATNAAADSPEIALALGEKLLENDPDDDSARASNLLLAFCNAGNFQTAVEFANQAPAEFRDNWLKVIFARWAQTNPQNAMAALDSISDSSAQKMAFQTAADTWAQNDPSTLAAFTAALPDGDNKTFALEKIVGNWSLQDPAGFSAWLNTSPPGVDFDSAVAEMISKADGANYSSEVAMQWVEGMNDSALKFNSLSRVLEQWNENDSAAAQNYLGNISWLDEKQRRNILVKLQLPRSLADNSGD